MMYAAWDHNPQGRFHEDGAIHWDQWLIVGGIHLVVGLVAGATLWLTLVALIRVFRKAPNNGI